MTKSMILHCFLRLTAVAKQAARAIVTQQVTLPTMNHCEDESIVVESTDDYVGSSYEVSLENTHSIDLFLTAFNTF